MSTEGLLEKHVLVSSEQLNNFSSPQKFRYSTVVTVECLLIIIN